MNRVLVVERRERAATATTLETEGFTVMTAINPTEAIAAVAAFRPDVVVVDATVPDPGTVSVCLGIRSAMAGPIVLFTGPCPERATLAAFEAGVDSVVVGPTGTHELVARVRALLRRLPVVTEESGDVLTVGPVVLDRARRELFVHGQEVRAPRREFDIAEVLMRDAGRVVPRRQLVHELWGTVRDTKSLDVQVGRLRHRLAEIEGVQRIVTVRGVGFRFLTDEALADERG